MSYRATDRFENWFITSLQTGINDTTNSFRLNNNLNVHQARLVIDPYDPSIREVVKVTSVDGNLVYVERGDDNTAPQYHLEGAIVALNVVAGDMNDLYADFAGVVDATNAANQAASDASSAASDASNAASDATTATGLANTATSNANAATTAANNAASSANTAATEANTEAGRASDAADAAEQVVDDITAAAFLAAHPVGSTYWNETVSTNPGSIYGGTWVALQGVVLGGRSTVSGSPFNVAAGTTIGADTHTLTTAQIPSHTHSNGTLTAASAGAHTHPYTVVRQLQSNSHDKGDYPSGRADQNSGTSTPSTNSAGAHTHNVTGTTSATGSDNSHNNIQRTLVGYLWKRTA